MFSQDLKINTKYGDILGSIDKTTGNKVFLGIPYAAPPIGTLRFKPPQPPSKWTDVRNALEFGNACIQKFSDIAEERLFGNQSEDCLFLNVWTPSKIDNPLPVMVWIHGGSFNSGSTNLPFYSGNNLSKQGNVIVVSLNYRLGILGFFTSDYLSKEDINWPTSGNYGLLDQNMALQWVKENISAFGGDSDNITIFGESAGSLSVCFQLLMPKSKGLFKRAILQSGSCSYPSGDNEKLRPDEIIEPQNKKTHLYLSSNYMNRLGCSDMNCMRKLSIENIKKFQNDNDLLTWPHTDGLVIPGDPYYMFNNGTYSKVDVLVGTTLNDGSIFSQDIKYNDFVNKVKKNYPIYYDKILEFYPESIYKTGFSALAQLITDFAYHCPSRSLLNIVSSNGGNAYQYIFSAVPSYLTEDSKILGSFHTSELYYLFNYPWNNIFNPKNSNFTQDEVILSNQVIDFWSSFAKSGVPNSANSSIKWQMYNNNDQNYMMLNVKELKIGKSFSKDVCDIYDLSIMSTLGTSIFSPTIFLAIIILILI